MRTILSTVKPTVGASIEIVNMATGVADTVSDKIVKMVPGNYQNSWCCWFEDGTHAMVVYWERRDDE